MVVVHLLGQLDILEVLEQIIQDQLNKGILVVVELLLLDILAVVVVALADLVEMHPLQLVVLVVLGHQTFMHMVQQILFYMQVEVVVEIEVVELQMEDQVVVDLEDISIRKEVKMEHTPPEEVVVVFLEILQDTQLHQVLVVRE